MIAWRITKVRYPPFDGTGARDWGGRWNSGGRSVVYAADSFAGAILEILGHALRPRMLPGQHHAVRIVIPDSAVERVDPHDVAGWNDVGARSAVKYGDAWYDARRSVALRVPSLPARPVGSVVVINTAHSDADGIEVSAPFPVPWDERLF